MRRSLFTSAVVGVLLVAGLVSAQVVLQQDQRGVSVQPGVGGLRLGPQHTANSVAGGSNPITALTTGTRVVLAVCSVASHIAQGVSPATATATSFLLPANTYLQLRVNDTDGIAFRADTTNGTCYVSEMN